MSGHNYFLDMQVSSASDAMNILKQCTSFEFRGYKGVGVARLKTGAEPEILSDDEGFFKLAEDLGIEINDMRSGSISELKPSNAQMFKIAESKMIESIEIEHDVKPSGPKLN